MGSEDPLLKRLYLRFRSPKVFVVALCTFIATMFTLHFGFGYDADWGGTNLTLSIEASIASAVITAAFPEMIRLLRFIIDRLEDLHTVAVETRRIAADVQEHGLMIEKTLKGVLLIAEAQRDMLMDHRALLQALNEGDARILKALTEGEGNGPGQ